MGTLSKIRQFANVVLEPAGVAVCRKQTLTELGAFPRVQERYQKCLEELFLLAQETVAPHIPEDNSRLPHVAELVGTAAGAAVCILNCLHEALKGDGDVCEFGVAEGATSRLLAHEIRNTNRRLWLYDSFEGLPAPTEKDVLKDDIYNLGSVEKYAGTMSVPETQVREKLKGIDFPDDRLQVVRGFIETVRDKGPFPEKIAFAYVDFDFYEPIKIALEIMKDRVTPNGWILVDDYDFFTEGGKAAVQEFIQENPSLYQLHLPGKFAPGLAMIQRNPK